MALDGLNAAAAAAILNDPKIDGATRTQGVVVSALVPGVLGLAVPLVLAQNSGVTLGGSGAGSGGGAAASNTTTVPPVTGISSDDAQKRLAGDRLTAVLTSVYSAEAKETMVVAQSPAAGTPVPLNSAVTLSVSIGPPPPPTSRPATSTPI